MCDGNSHREGDEEAGQNVMPHNAEGGNAGVDDNQDSGDDEGGGAEYEYLHAQ